MKYKTIKINPAFHALLKVFCEMHGYKLNQWCEMQLQSKFAAEEFRLSRISKESEEKT